jgi:hypothetical protein
MVDGQESIYQINYLRFLNVNLEEITRFLTQSYSTDYINIKKNILTNYEPDIKSYKSSL